MSTPAPDKAQEAFEQWHRKQASCCSKCEKKWERIQTLEVELKGSDNALAAAQSRITQLEAVVKAAGVAMSQIAEGRGRYSMDQYQFACNTIADMKQIALDYLSVKSLTAPQAGNPHPHIWTDAYPLSQQTTPVGQYCSAEGCGEWKRATQSGEPVKVLDATDEHPAVYKDSSGKLVAGKKYESIRSTSSKEHGDRK